MMNNSDLLIDKLEKRIVALEAAQKEQLAIDEALHAYLVADINAPWMSSAQKLADLLWRRIFDKRVP